MDYYTRKDLRDKLARAIYRDNPQIKSFEPGLISSKTYDEADGIHKFMADCQAGSCIRVLDEYLRTHRLDKS